MKGKEIIVNENETVTTQIRLSKALHEYIQAKSSEAGISKNAVMCVLMDLGKKIYESDVTLHDPSG
jgi:hypothetical protein